VAARGGQDEVTAQEGVLIDLIVGTAIKVQRANAYLATLPSVVDRRHRRLWPIVLDVKRLEGHLANLLRNLGLDRRAKTVPSRFAVAMAAPAAIRASRYRSTRSLVISSAF
jgi:hypothetical protein